MPYISITQTIKILSKLREFMRFFSLEPSIFAKNNNNIIQKNPKNLKIFVDYVVRVWYSINKR